jgi:bifunctional non-homologous end joining protein LigD
LHEIKHAGFRLIAQKHGERVKLYGRHGNDLTKRFPLIVEAMMRLRASSCVIDGEAVTCGEGGIPSFDLLRHKLHDGRVPLCVRFDRARWRRPAGEALEQRKVILWRLLNKGGGGLLINEWIEGDEADGATVFLHACSLGLEGIVSKRKARGTTQDGRPTGSS